MRLLDVAAVGGEKEQGLDCSTSQSGRKDCYAYN